MTMTIAEVFEAMPMVFNSVEAAGMTKTFQWRITGEQSGTWAFKIVRGQGELVPGGIEKPDVTITVSDKDWLSIIEGTLSPQNAFMSGKVKITGDLMLAMRLPKLFPTQREQES